MGARGAVQIFSVIQEEETSFSRTLQKGLRRYKAVAEVLRRGEAVLRWCELFLIRRMCFKVSCSQHDVRS